MRESHKRYRTKHQMAIDVAIAVNSEMSYGGVYTVIDKVLWAWSGFEGKLEGCPRWTPEAREDFARLGKSSVIHEHVVPRKVLIQTIMEMKNPSPAGVYDKLDTFCIAVVITKAQDVYLNQCGLRQTMPSGWDKKDPWARYSTAGLPTNY
jgi:hypothetical protein